MLCGKARAGEEGEESDGWYGSSASSGEYGVATEQVQNRWRDLGDLWGG